MTDILLFIIIVLLSLIFLPRVFNSFAFFKRKCLTDGVRLGAEKTIAAVIAKAKEGKVFQIANSQEVIKLKIVKKKK